MDLNESQCVPIEDWQSGHHPLCNTLHELDLIHLRDFSGNNVELVGKQGYWRNAWRIDLVKNEIFPNTGEVIDSFILKTPK